MSNFLETYTTKIKTWANGKFCTEDGVRELIDSMLYPLDTLCADLEFQVTSGQNLTLWGGTSGTFWGKIDWGDSITTPFYTANPNHVYSTAGTYRVKVYGSFPTFNTSNADSISMASLRKIITLRNLTALNAGFANCTGLTTLESGFFDDCPLVTSLDSCFYNCTSLVLRGDEFTLSTLSGRQMWFAYCFYTASTSNQVAGTAPELWNAGLASGSDTTRCFYNRTLLSNYADIPAGWK
jgi:hypothetical protein